MFSGTSKYWFLEIGASGRKCTTRPKSKRRGVLPFSLCCVSGYKHLLTHLPRRIVLRQQERLSGHGAHPDAGLRSSLLS